MTTSIEKVNSKMASVKPVDAITFLRADHKRVSALFGEFEKARGASKKRLLVSKICAELSLHAQLEEEVFYPAVKQAIKDKRLVPEATVEHASLKMLIAQVDGVEPDGERYDATIHVMAEYVKHHIKEEQNQMFPRVMASKLDLIALGAKLATRKAELLAAVVTPFAPTLAAKRSMATTLRGPLSSRVPRADGIDFPHGGDGS